MPAAMVSRATTETAGESFSRARCRCGHLPTHHMVVVPIGSTFSFRLEPTGPCAICGEAVCRRFQPGAP
ncbi:MAG TPA: hypothetical protein VEK13_03280 [Thermoplasmata archaeon]|nr:hypothetical protein [Thermoplasmata archaeon]